MTIGTGTYDPFPFFALPRSYVYDFHLARYGDTLSSVPPTIIIHAVPPDPTFAVVELNPDFVPWSSSSWRLDQIVAEFYYEVPPSIVRNPLPFKITYACDPVTLRPSLYMQWSSTLPDFQTFILPPQPPGYWLPPPLP